MPGRLPWVQTTPRHQDDDEHDAYPLLHLKMLTVVLPIVSALVVTIKSQLRFNEKYSVCELAATRIVNEIYAYRARAGEYDFFAKAAAADDDEGESKAANDVSIAVKSPLTLSRELLVSKVQEHWGEVMAGDVGKSGAVSYTMVSKHADSLDSGLESSLLRKTMRMRSQVPGRRTRSFMCSVLHHHVETKLYGKKEPRMQGPKSKGGADTGGRAAQNAQNVIDDDDYVSPITIESYIEFRAKPISDKFQRTAPTLSSTLNCLVMFQFAVTAGGGVLGAFGAGIWVALSVSVATCTNLVIEELGLHTRLAVMNNGVRDIQVR